MHIHIYTVSALVGTGKEAGPTETVGRGAAMKLIGASFCFFFQDLGVQRWQWANLLLMAEIASPTSQLVPWIVMAWELEWTIRDNETFACNVSEIWHKPVPACPTTWPAWLSGIDRVVVIFSWAALFEVFAVTLEIWSESTQNQVRQLTSQISCFRPSCLTYFWSESDLFLIRSDLFPSTNLSIELINKSHDL